MTAFLIDDSAGPIFLAAEIEVFRPGGAAPGVGYVIGQAPIGATPPAATAAADSVTWRASDLGYVAPATNPALVFPPTLAEGFSTNRVVDLAPGGSAASVGWGALRVLAFGGLYETTGRNSDQRAVRILIGRKIRDASRDRWTDPALADMTELFAGLAQPWASDDAGVTIPLRDASVWAERPLQAETYDGTGTVEGNATLTGQRLPRTRGGSAAAPVTGIEPVQIDPVNNIWQWTDGPGTIVALYEGGKAVFTVGANVADLWTGSTAAGAYRTDSARGLFQLGSPRAGRITLDGYASFPAAGAVTNPAMIAHALLDEDAALPAGTLDDASFSDLAALYPYTAGWHWPGTQGDTAASAAALMLASLGARLVPTRAGQLRAMLLRAPPDDAVAAGSYTVEQIIRARRMSLPAGLEPPPMRVRLAYARQHTVLGEGELNATLTDTQRQTRTTQDKIFSYAEPAISVAWRRPSDPPPIVTALTAQADANALLLELGAFYVAERRLYAIELPISLGARHDLGDYVEIAYPLDDLATGKMGLVVGEQLRVADSSITLMVLV